MLKLPEYRLLIQREDYFYDCEKDLKDSITSFFKSLGSYKINLDFIVPTKSDTRTLSSFDGHDDIEIPYVSDKSSVPIGIAKLILDYFGFYHTMENLEEQSKIKNYPIYDLEVIIDDVINYITDSDFDSNSTRIKDVSSIISNLENGLIIPIKTGEQYLILYALNCDKAYVINCNSLKPYQAIPTSEFFDSLTCAWDLSPCMQESVPEESLNLNYTPFSGVNKKGLLEKAIEYFLSFFLMV